LIFILQSMAAQGGDAEQLFFFEDRSGRESSKPAGSKRKGNTRDDGSSTEDEEDEMSDEEGSSESDESDDDAEGSSDDASTRSESLAEHIDEEEEEEEDQPTTKQSKQQQKAPAKAAKSAVTIAGTEAAGAGSEATGRKGKKGGPVWEDPADAQISVSLASKARLRRLRASEQQDVVDGEEYEAVLRKQHAALHPRTQWAAARQKGGRRAGAAGVGEGERAGDEGEEEVDELEELAAAAMPLVQAGRSTRLLPGASCSLP
jgi:U3 small nucleolar RNA-associated protein 18